MTIRFLVDSWENAEHDAPEICMTAGSLRIAVGPHSLTRNEDGWSQTVKPAIRVSAYPLALWLAASWWRLRWEPLPTGRKAPASWRLAHEVASSGYGFLWPRVVFACDGENMQIWSIPTRSESEQPIHFLADRHDVVPVKDFIDAVDTFMNLVLARLDAVSLNKTDLKSLWEEVQEERSNVNVAEFRRIEAMLGFDPDESDPDIVEQFVRLGRSIGSSAMGEIASACSSVDPVAHLAQINHVAEMKGISGKFSLPGIAGEKQAPIHQPPWVRGQQLAHAVRDAIGMNGQAISDTDLSALAEVKREKAFEEPTTTERLPVGIGVREKGDNVKIVLRKRNRVGRRFEFARLLCDHLLSDATDRWLPATDTKTIRQKWQRAFAAEFLCPIDALVAKLGDDFSDDAVDDAAAYFGVSERTVTSQLVNHNLLPVFALEDKSGTGSFPYLI